MIGRREVMAPAADSFISTSYHTERVGPPAAVKTFSQHPVYFVWRITNDIYRVV